jgi:predicted N-acetyltransferase YhbS
MDQCTTVPLAALEGAEEIVIRVAEQEDAEEIFLVHSDSVENLCRSYYSSKQISMWMDGRSPATYHEAIMQKRIFVADDNHSLVGFVEYAPGEIVKLFVRGISANRGIGDSLMKIVLSKALEGGISKVRVESTRNAQSFYERYGFLKNGEGIFSRGGSEVSIEIIELLLDI